MTTASQPTHDVAVVGLGPVGATLAALLADAGLSVIAIERQAEVYPMPRAAHFDHEIMRLFQGLGLAEALAPHIRAAPAYEFRAADGAVLMRFDLSGQSPSGWAASYMIHQPGVESAVRAKLAAAAKVEIRLASAFAGFTQDGAGVSVSVEGGAEPNPVRARFLVGCDGASSAVRATMGVQLFDYGFDEPWLVIDTLVDDPDAVPSVNLQICDPARPTTCVLMGPGRHRWEFMLEPGETAEAAMADASIAARLAPWNCLGKVRVERKAVYRFHGLVADRWREGRVLLAGDAAHQTPPFAGQGMCAGMRDAANLAWKLAAIVKGGAPVSLLETYQPEREPSVRAVIELAIAMGRLVCTRDPEAARARDAEMSASFAAGHRPMAPVQPGLSAGCLKSGSPGAGELFPQPWAGAGAAKLDDVAGPGAWLIAREGPGGAAVAGPTPVSLFDLGQGALAAFAEPLVAWLDARGAAAVLVRPDRYVFGTGGAADLAAAFARAQEETLAPIR